MSFHKFPYAITKVDGDLHNEMLKDFPGQNEGIVQIGPEKWAMPAKFEQFANQIYNFEARPDDVWICTLPRSGTTWTQEMIWLICNDLDYEGALQKELKDRSPYLEFNVIMPDATLSQMQSTMNENDFKKLKSVFEPSYDRLANITAKRFIKTHLPIKLLPRSVTEVSAKVVYVARNPKDMCVSWYHMHKSFPGWAYIGDFERFSKYFMDDLTTYTPYWKHVLDGWQNRHLENVHFMFYEDCKTDLASSLKKLADFLGHPLKDKDLPKLVEHLSFESAQKNLSINYSLDPKDKTPNFLRRGMIGGNPEITPELSEKFDEWIKRNLVGTDFKFPVNV